MKELIINYSKDNMENSFNVSSFKQTFVSVCSLKGTKDRVQNNFIRPHRKYSSHNREEFSG